MRSRTIAVAASVLLVAGLGAHYLDALKLGERPVEARIGNARALETAYNRWAATYKRGGGDQELILPLGYSKGLSARFTRAQGQARFDLVDGSVSVTVSGLPAEDAFDVWLVDNRPGPRHSVKPEPGDALVRLGSLQHAADTATLEADLAEVIHPGFEIDLVTITRGGEDPGQGGLLFGSASLFQRLYYNKPGGAVAAFGDVVTPIRSGSGQQAPWTSPFRAFVPSPAYAQGMGGDPVLAALVAEGEDIFFNETFDGNGRTCGTCHRAENNFTIDPAFIATLPDDDPLFVAEFNPDLNPDNLALMGKKFENPALMREFGLILENQDGFGDLVTNFNMRGVPHTLALPTSVDGPGGDSDPRLGWSGDGAPLAGNVRDFAIGAVTQHFTKTLARVPDVDFTLPTDDELDALEAFQLSLGRQEELTLPLLLKGTVPFRGQEIFLDNGLGKCNLCHANAGANGFFGGGNGNFDTGVEELPDQPADLTGELNPPDDGFGIDPGNGEFNTPTLVEAADTGPFFHNNSVETIEGAVAFYNGDSFNDSPAAVGPGGFPVGLIKLDATQVVAVAAFLRVINALENIRSAVDYEERALDDIKEAEEYLSLAYAENFDAIQVLHAGGLHAEAVVRLQEAGELLQLASQTSAPGKRKQHVNQAIDEQEAARGMIVD